MSSHFVHLLYTPGKQGTSDILGKMSFWYHCKKHTFSFNLIPKWSLYSSYFLRYDNLCLRPQSVSLEVWFWDIGLLKVSYSYSYGFDRLQKMQNSLFENVWRSGRNYMEVIENILRYVKNNPKISKSTDTMPTSNVHISSLCDLFLFYWSATHFCLVTLRSYRCWSVLLNNIYLYNTGKKDYDRPFLSFTDSMHSAYYKQYDAELQFNRKHNQFFRSQAINNNI